MTEIMKEAVPMKKIAFTLAALALAAGAQAQSNNMDNQAHTYGLLSIGQAHLNVDCTGVQTCDKNTTGGRP